MERRVPWRDIAEHEVKQNHKWGSDVRCPWLSMISIQKSLSIVIAAGFLALGFAAHGAASQTKKKSVAKSSSKKGKIATSRAPARQLSPTPDRYKQIQDALAKKGYLPAEQANGQWTEASTDALKKFQTDQNLDATGKINSLSLIALGLGPKHEMAPPKE